MDGVRVACEDTGVATVTLDRPARYNALDDTLMFDTLPALFADLAQDDAVRVVVVTGSGRAFCAGADLASDAFDAPDPAWSQARVQRAHALLVTLRTMPKPSIAAINGPAVGAGLGLAAACDLRVASSAARFGAPFVKMGLCPDFGISYLLPQLIGLGAALDMLLTGRFVGAEEAIRLGLANRLVEDAVAEAVDLARIMAAYPPGALAATRHNTIRGLDLSMEAEILDQEPRSVAIALHSAEFREQFRRYRESLSR